MNIQMEELEKDMTPILLEDLGMRYPTEKSKRKFRYGLYKCQYCGRSFTTRMQSVYSGATKSCKCLRANNSKSHGLRNHILYPTWNNMIQRCTHLNRADSLYYFERGIKVCDRWLDITNFINDMYPTYQVGLTLDRIDVNGNYEPDNCRWAKKTTQARNTVSLRCDNTSGYRGVSWNKVRGEWGVQICVANKIIRLGFYQTSLEAAKVYERYVRLNNLEHNFTPVLTEEEIKMITKEDK